MNNFNITLNINDICCSKNCTNSVQKEISVTSSTQTINLQCSYILNVIQVSENYITILLQNGSNVVIRDIFSTFTTEILLPCTNCKHIISISTNIISTR